MKIFVYGTLKRGQELHYALGGQQFLGEARTRPCYRMVSLGRYPGLVGCSEANGGRAIGGEVWEVDATCLAELDVIEGVAEGEYMRVPVPLQSPFAEIEVEAYIYLGDTAGLAEVGDCW